MITEENVTTENSGTYIGDFPARDVCAFCNVEWQDGTEYNDQKLGVVKKLWVVANGYHSFHLPAALLPMDWLVYRGMIPQAIIVYIAALIYIFLVTLLFLHILPFFPISESYHASIASIIAFLSYEAMMGFVSIHLYYKHVCRCLEKRNLKGRKDLECEELKESLAKQGKPSVIRAILFRIIMNLFIACAEGILVTVRYGILG